ncbi:MAG: AMP-binding protein [Proteobacteria bacterium]|nr:AMP-binding protein [Pseudomonadota bacterium]
MPTPTPGAYRDAGLTRPTTTHQWRADGTLLMGAAEPPLRLDVRGMASFVPRWARERGAQPAFAERAGDGWRTWTWAELHQRMTALAAALLEAGLSPQRPLMMLSGNSLEQLLLIAAAEYVGIPSAPVSPSYSLLSGDHGRLRDIHALVEPAAVFVQSGAVFAAALRALGTPAAQVIAVDDAAPGQRRLADLPGGARQDARLASAADVAAVEAAHAALQPQQTARLFFTSGSTGAPKGVPISYANVATMIGQSHWAQQTTLHEPPVMLDWLPWNHLFGGLGNLCRVFALGGTYHLDDGRPLPGQFERTLRNLREVSPTLYATVPAAWGLLAQALERDPALARQFFARLKFAGYGGASLPRDVWQRFQDAAVRAVGQRIVFTSGFGSTETTGQGMTFNRPSDDVGNVGVPQPGMEVKLIPLEGGGESGDGRYEIRMRGPHIFPGYLKRPDLTAAAIDAEGFYALGDAVRLADPADPGAGLRYAGRCVEDFKLGSGTWVRTGSARVALIEQCSPLVADAVICGHDRDQVAALAWPDVAACRAPLIDVLYAEPAPAAVAVR